MTPIAERVIPPTPAEVKRARRAARLTQSAAALLVASGTADRAERTWQNYEAAEGTKAHRAIPLATWELFLLLTGQHPTHHLVAKTAAA